MEKREQIERDIVRRLPLGIMADLGADRMVDWLAPVIAPSATVTALFGLYATIGLLTFFLYRHLSPQVEADTDNTPAPLGPSRGIVYRLAALFSVDAFGGVLLQLLT